jgi:hypothetical protein
MEKPTTTESAGYYILTSWLDPDDAVALALPALKEGRLVRVEWDERDDEDESMPTLTAESLARPYNDSGPPLSRDAQAVVLCDIIRGRGCVCGVVVRHERKKVMYSSGVGFTVDGADVPFEEAERLWLSGSEEDMWSDYAWNAMVQRTGTIRRRALPPSPSGRARRTGSVVRWAVELDRTMRGLIDKLGADLKVYRISALDDKAAKPDLEVVLIDKSTPERRKFAITHFADGSWSGRSYWEEDQV